MAVQIFTVAQYRAHIDSGVSLPEGDTIQIVDNAGAIERLTVDDIEGLAFNRVTLLNATGNAALAFTLAQFQALGAVGFGAEDKLTLRDTQFYASKLADR